MKIFDKTAAISWGVSLVLIGLIAIAAVWSVGGLGNTLRASAAGPAAINLGSAGNFAILAKSGISTTGSTVVVGDIGVSPAPATYITGFALMLPAVSAFSTSAQISGKVYAPDYADPTSANLTTAVLDMQNAYTDGMSRAPGVTELGAGNIGGLTLAPGIYKWGTGVTIPTDVTLSGGAGDTWIFEIAQNLTVSSGAKVVLSGGAQASNIFWVVAGQTTLGASAVFNGNILDQTAIVLNTGAQLNGRALAQTAVTLDSNMVIAPTSAPSTQNPTPTPTPTSTPTPPSTSSGQAAPTYTSTPNSTQNPDMNQTSGNAPVYTAPIPQIRTITENLYETYNGTDVMILQQFLISKNMGPDAQALGQVGGTGHFGVLTRAALAEFQANAGINPALGNFGPITRGYISTHY